MLLFGYLTMGLKALFLGYGISFFQLAVVIVSI